MEARLIEPFLERVRRLDTLEAVHDALSCEFSAMGFDRFAYHVLRPPGGKRLLRSLLSSYPWAWLMHYKEQDYVNTDPVLREACTRLTPFKWDDRFRAMELSNRQRRFFGEAGEFGIEDGITVPIHGPEGGMATLNLSSRSKPAELDRVWRERRHDLQLIACYAHDAILRCVYVNVDETPIHLTERECECLLWTARGKTTWEVGQVLSITESTARFHLRNAMVKLDVFSKHHAVVKAILLGLIVP